MFVKNPKLYVQNKNSFILYFEQLLSLLCTQCETSTCIRYINKIILR